MLSANPAFAQAAPAAPAPNATPAKSPYMFTGDAALTVNVVKADKTADFEMIVGKLQEALQKSVRPERTQQAAGWKVYKASEPGPSGSVMYVFLFDPVVKDTDYTPSASIASAHTAFGMIVIADRSFSVIDHPTENSLLTAVSRSCRMCARNSRVQPAVSARIMIGVP